MPLKRTCKRCNEKFLPQSKHNKVCEECTRKAHKERGMKTKETKQKIIESCYNRIKEQKDSKQIYEDLQIERKKEKNIKRNKKRLKEKVEKLNKSHSKYYKKKYD